MFKRKRIFLILIILILGIYIYYCYQDLNHAIILKDIKTKYNDNQRECEIVGITLNYVYVKRDFNNSSSWELTNINTHKKYNFELKSNGAGGLVGLPEGEYYLQETSNSNKDKLVQNKYYLNFSKHNHSYILEPDYPQGGVLKIYVKDKNNNYVSGVKLNLFGDNKNQITTLSGSRDDGALVYNNTYNGSKIIYVEQADIPNPKRFYYSIPENEIIKVYLTINEEGIIE